MVFLFGLLGGINHLPALKNRKIMRMNCILKDMRKIIVS
jgi:hypothetical protein